MILRDFLITVNTDEVAEAYCRNYMEKDAEPTEGKIHAVLKQFMEVLLDVIPSGRSDSFLLAVRDKSDESLDSFIVEGKEVRAFFKPYEGNLEEDISAAIASDKAEEVYALAKVIRGCLPETYDYIFAPWEDTLGAKVNEENIRETGENDFAAAVLFEMSFNGFDRGSQQRRREELEECLKKAERHARTGFNSEGPLSLEEAIGRLREEVETRLIEGKESERNERRLRQAKDSLRVLVLKYRLIERVAKELVWEDTND